MNTMTPSAVTNPVLPTDAVGSAPDEDAIATGLISGLADETGASTAEYAITTLAACGFAAVLVVLLKSGEVRSLLMNVITSALALGS